MIWFPITAFVIFMIGLGAISHRALTYGSEMKKEYDFSNARSNKYAKKYAEGSNIVIIEPDLVKFFPDSKSVNKALRALASVFPKPNKDE
jgi:hypothetical protein